MHNCLLIDFQEIKIEIFLTEHCTLYVKIYDSQHYQVYKSIQHPCIFNLSFIVAIKHCLNLPLAPRNIYKN